MKARSQRKPRARRLQPGEADFLIKQIADRGDAIGLGPNGTVFVLAEIDRCKGRMKFPQTGRVKNPQMVGVVKGFCLGWPPCLLVGALGVVPPVVLMG
jgi:hypothetical protein